LVSPLWEQALSPSDHALLTAPGPAMLPARPAVLVVGGGIIGVATAAMCARAGLGEVLLIERGRLGCGASGGAVGLLSPDPHRAAEAPGSPIPEFGAASLGRYRRLRAEMDLDLRSVDLVMPPGPDGHADVLSDQASVNPLRLTAQLARHAGTVATGVAMTGADIEHGRVATVRTTRGDVRPRALVVATGLAPDWLPELAQDHLKGHVIATEPAPFSLPRAIVGEHGAVWQLDDRRLIFGGTVDAGDRSPDVRDDRVALLRRELSVLVPESAGLRIAHAWCCFRPAIADGLPVIDRVPGLDNAWVAAGFYRSGIVMAAATGTALADWIATGTRPAGIAAFGAARPPQTAAV
jgi:glycine/D-amino acid oxidase-like deaminating enzyme